MMKVRRTDKRVVFIPQPYDGAVWITTKILSSSIICDVIFFYLFQCHPEISGVLIIILNSERHQQTYLQTFAVLGPTNLFDYLEASRRFREGYLSKVLGR